ncbi:hypothetical protein C3486_31580 [Streptomyces sp. Ru73]|uniref:hypothetical protein n=1 Tax=Streptomyces sp. Ru73 TaxID=2080748 RepID=UPI000CDDAD70|nr:hypothetical protein [Streptomyces sp. Ru73]POX36804.1 hypothetical protein C3486_31580 [Streptomyces sp. Ru73]
MSLPGADELFRTTGGTALQSSSPRRPANGTPANGEAPRVPAPGGEADPAAPQQGGAAQRRPEGDPAAAASGATAPAEQHSGRDTADEAGKGRRRQEPAAAAAAGTGAPAAGTARRRGRGANRRPSGRERHDEKITVYVSAEELMDLEHARLVLRGEHGLAVDRGRIVREAVAVVLADLESRGDASILVRRLRGR